ncbi:Uncharacterised protein [Mycobacteroides abscessus subsp. abscessus]|nr:Uncharacterised protein [Mycobacteroides abscessus subsp. abscessus]
MVRTRSSSADRSEFTRTPPAKSANSSASREARRACRARVAAASTSAATATAVTIIIKMVSALSVSPIVKLYLGATNKKLSSSPEITAETSAVETPPSSETPSTAMRNRALLLPTPKAVSKKWMNNAVAGGTRIAASQLMMSRLRPSCGTDQLRSRPEVCPCVTMWTSMAPESRMTAAATPSSTIRAHRDLREVPSTS